MKRETKRAMATFLSERLSDWSLIERAMILDALDSDARLRAELQRKDKALRLAEAALVNCIPLPGVPMDALSEVRAALKKPTRRKR